MSDATARRLERLAWLSVAAAIVTIGLKLLAWRLTDSVGLLSDAAESVVNLAAALIAVLVLRVAAQPPDDEHPHGHEKAEYLAAGVEGALILAAAATIAWVSIGRLLEPQPIERVGLGLVVSLVAALVNLGVALVLIRAGRRERSVTLEADGRHLMTDVVTTAGVLIGVILVAATGWERLDPIVALAVAVMILLTGAGLLRRMTGGLMDRALPAGDLTALDDVLSRMQERGIRFHAVRTRVAGRRAFVSLHVLVPGGWSVQQGHDVAEEVEREIRGAIPNASVLTHLEPLEDPLSFEDTGLDREP